MSLNNTAYVPLSDNSAATSTRVRTYASLPRGTILPKASSPLSSTTTRSKKFKITCMTVVILACFIISLYALATSCRSFSMYFNDKYLCTHSSSIPNWYLYPIPTGGEGNGDPAINQSTFYSVHVQFLSHGGANASGDSFVYENSLAHRYEYVKEFMFPDQSVSWTSFAMIGQSVNDDYENIEQEEETGGSIGSETSSSSSIITKTLAILTITSLTFDIEGCIIRPSSYTLDCVQTSSRTVQVNLTTTMLKLSIELLNTQIGNTETFVRHPLFVFVDPPEDPCMVFSPTDPNTMYFAPGVYRFPEGQRVVDNSIRQVYIAPGAFIIGGFRRSTVFGVGGGCPLTIAGRGIVSGQEFPWHSPLFTWALINLDQGAPGTIVDGITLIDSPEFYFATFATQITLRNVKMAVAWPFNSDGFDVHDNALIQDVFVRSNDDSIKLVGSNSVVERVVVWQMINGGAIQMGWIDAVRQNILVSQIDVIHVDYCNAWLASDKTYFCMASDNEAVIDNAPDGTQVYSTSNISIVNMRVEGDGVRLFNIVMPSTASGTIRNLAFTNLSVDTLSFGMHNNEWNTFQGGSSVENGIQGVEFFFLHIGSFCIESVNDPVANFRIDASSVTGVEFSC